MSLSPSRTPAPERERERERERARQAHQAAGFTLPPWIIQAITAAALPLWIWVISLSQERARTELRLTQLETSAAATKAAMLRLERLDASLTYIERALDRLQGPQKK